MDCLLNVCLTHVFNIMSFRELSEVVIPRLAAALQPYRHFPSVGSLLKSTHYKVMANGELGVM